MEKREEDACMPDCEMAADVSRQENLLLHASGQKSFESARCYEAGLVVVRRLSEKVLPDACPKKFAIPKHNSTSRIFSEVQQVKRRTP